MARTKGALNKRTLAALDAASKGKLAAGSERTLLYLQKIVDDPSKPEDVRMRAADILLPYQKPKLSAVEQTIVDERDTKDPAELAARLAALLLEKPGLHEQIQQIMQRAKGEKALDINGSISPTLQ